MLLDQTIKNATEFVGNAETLAVIGICCVIGIAIFAGVWQTLSGPCVRRHIRR